MSEEILEEGTVIESGDGIATVSIVRGGACEECGARIFCKSSGEENPKVTALDLLGAKPGDRVRIAAPGKHVLLVSFLLYGIPIVLLLLGIALGSQIFPSNKELYGSLLGIGLCALYYWIVRIKAAAPGKGDRWMPRIDKIL